LTNQAANIESEDQLEIPQMVDREFIPTENLKADVLRLIKWRGNGLSFVELCKYLPKARGHSFIEIKSNLWLWDGVSPEMIGVLNELISEGEIHFAPCSQFTYFSDGGGLKLPIGDIGKNYKAPHWLPIALNLRKAKEAA
jgi:hypothetical protein